MARSCSPIACAAHFVRLSAKSTRWMRPSERSIGSLRPLVEAVEAGWRRSIRGAVASDDVLRGRSRLRRNNCKDARLVERSPRSVGNDTAGAHTDDPLGKGEHLVDARKGEEDGDPPPPPGFIKL